jgi:hypothetical protein
MSRTIALWGWSTCLDFSYPIGKFNVLINASFNLGWVPALLLRAQLLFVDTPLGITELNPC